MGWKSWQEKIGLGLGLFLGPGGFPSMLAMNSGLINQEIELRTI